MDGQTNVEIHVLQGEREMASDNKSLGTFRLDGIPPAPRGVPQIEVTFDIDANGILSVTAKDKGSGKEQSISITGASTLSDSEVDKMVKDAEANASADKEKREKIDLKNQAETLVYQAEKQMGELGDKVDADAKAKLEEKRLKLKEATEKDDYDAMKTLLEELQQELYTVGASVYQQEGAAAGAGAPGADDGAGAHILAGEQFIGTRAQDLAHRLVQPLHGPAARGQGALTQADLRRHRQREPRGGELHRATAVDLELRGRRSKHRVRRDDAHHPAERRWSIDGGE